MERKLYHYYFLAQGQQRRGAWGSACEPDRAPRRKDGRVGRPGSGGPPVGQA